MKPTMKTCTTEIGLKRKRDRMISAELAKRYPHIFDEIAFEVDGYIEFDQFSPTSQPISVANGKESVRHKAFRKAKFKILEEAIENKTVVRYFGRKRVHIVVNPADYTFVDAEFHTETLAIEN